MQNKDSMYGYDTTANGFQFQSQISNIISEKEKETSKKGLSIQFKIVIGVVIFLLVAGGIITLILVLKGGGSDNKKISCHGDNCSINGTSPELPSSDDPQDDIFNFNSTNNNNITLNISYRKNELKFFDIEKKINSRAIGDENKTEESQILYYKSVLGIHNIINESEGDPNSTYYEGFFAFLSINYFNSTTKENTLINLNEKLYQLINNNLGKNFSENEKNYIFKNGGKEEIEYLIKVDFYKDGRYKDLHKPLNLPEENVNDCKEILDLILPKISKDFFFLIKTKKTIF